MQDECFAFTGFYYEAGASLSNWVGLLQFFHGWYTFSRVCVCYQLCIIHHQHLRLPIFTLIRPHCPTPREIYQPFMHIRCHFPFNTLHITWDSLPPDMHKSWCSYLVRSDREGERRTVRRRVRQLSWATLIRIVCYRFFGDSWAIWFVFHGVKVEGLAGAKAHETFVLAFQEVDFVLAVFQSGNDYFAMALSYWQVCDSIFLLTNSFYFYDLLFFQFTVARRNRIISLRHQV